MHSSLAAYLGLVMECLGSSLTVHLQYFASMKAVQQSRRIASGCCVVGVGHDSLSTPDSPHTATARVMGSCSLLLCVGFLCRATAAETILY